MTTPLVFSFERDKLLARSLTQHLNAREGQFEFRHFPDGESYLNLISEEKDKTVMIVVSLCNPDPQVVPLLFLARLMREHGAKSIGLVVPYLAYMRQDKLFKPGEALTSQYFSALISPAFDWLVTVDPHLHRYESLDQVYPIPNRVMHAKKLMADWLRQELPEAYLLGPDEESEQWVSAVANIANLPFGVATKTRRGDRDVSIEFPPLLAEDKQWVVILDDIISSGYTMLETVRGLKLLGVSKIACLAVHGIFANQIDHKLLSEGVSRIITTNAILHASNQIDLAPLLAKGVHEFLKGEVS